MHGRIHQLEITKTGRDLLARCRPHIQRIEKRLAAGLSANEERVIRRWLVRVAMDAPQGER
jgi:DNA-binding MarR family transcriptional regulator